MPTDSNGDLGILNVKSYFLKKKEKEKDEKKIKMSSAENFTQC